MPTHALSFPDDFPIARKWPPADPRRLQLYSLPTPNGVKVAIALEELGLPYEPHRVAFDANDQHSAEFTSLNPNGKIPAIIDPDGPDDRPIGLFESGASSSTSPTRPAGWCPTMPPAATRLCSG